MLRPASRCSLGQRRRVQLHRHRGGSHALGGGGMWPLLLGADRGICGPGVGCSWANVVPGESTTCSRPLHSAAALTAWGVAAAGPRVDGHTPEAAATRRLLLKLVTRQGNGAQRGAARRLCGANGWVGGQRRRQAGRRRQFRRHGGRRWRASGTHRPLGNGRRRTAGAAGPLWDRAGPFVGRRLRRENGHGDWQDGRGGMSAKRRLALPRLGKTRR